jgi:hypothetical protein
MWHVGVPSSKLVDLLMTHGLLGPSTIANGSVPDQEIILRNQDLLFTDVDGMHCTSLNMFD